VRHGMWLVVVGIAALIAWRVCAVVASGHDLHAIEVAARAKASEILRAELARAAAPPPDAAIAPYEFLATLVAEGRVSGLTRVAGGARDLWRAGDYLFHVRLLNKLDRPLLRPPDDLRAEPGLGLKFELWAWPAERHQTSLALFFASTSGFLLQGDNGLHAGTRARPEEGDASPVRDVEAAPGGAGKHWITLEQAARR